MASEASPARASVVMVTKDRQIDRRILLEADSLEGAGWQVTIVAMPADGEAAADDPRVVRIRPDAQPSARRENLLLGAYRTVRRHLPMGSPLMRTLKGIAWRHLVDPEAFYHRLFDAALAQRPAAVYMAHDLPLLPVAARAARLHGARLVYDSHELYAEQDFSEREKAGWRAMEAREIGACDAVITVNASIARELQERHGLAQVHVVHNAERARPAAARSRRFHEQLRLPPDDLVLLMQGGLSAGRHLDVLVAAFAQVRNPRVHLVVMGEGVLADSLLAQVRRSGLQARVHVLPAVPQADLLAWTEAADAGVIPYQATCLNNYYCTPNKLFEFIAAGLPVLASDLPELRRFVAGHGIGEVADLGDAGRIARAVDGFFAEPERLRGWREAAQRARMTVNWGVEGQKLVQVFEGLR